ncbi:MAG: MFS transporter, partial [Acidimicrobiia bacterium]
MKRGTASVTRAVAAMMSARGPGFQRLAMAHAWAVAGDTLVALSLAGTLFFQVPTSGQARSNVALYLLLTLAPFAVLGPFLGTLFARFPSAYRAGLMLSSGARIGVVAGMFIVGLDSISLYPLAFLLLVFSRTHGIARASILPVVLDRPVELVGANARIARIGLLASAAVVPLGAGIVRYVGT